MISSFLLLVDCLHAQTNNNILPTQSNPKENDPQKDIELIQLLEILKNTSGLTFIYEADQLEKQKINFEGISLVELNQVLLQEITKQTGLEFLPISDNTFVVKEIKNRKLTLTGKVSDKFGSNLAGANILIKDANLGNITNDNGEYDIQLPRGNYTICCSYIGYESDQKEIEITGNQSINLDFVLRKNLNLEEILVVGNRFLPKTIQETAVPVDVLGKNEIEGTTQMELTQLLQFEAPSFHSTYQTISDGTDHVDPISLKGLGPDQVLILVNGKRRHNSSLVNVNGTIGRGSVGTDLNAIPIGAIKKIEILKDGAAAQYGSDAIAGVINLILKDKSEQGSIQLNTGITNEGDGKYLSAHADYGFKMTKKGHTNINLYFQSREAINRSGNYEGPIFGDSRDENELLVNSFFEQTGFKDKRVMSAGNAALTNMGILLNSTFTIGDVFEFYTFGSFNFRQGLANGFYRFPFQEEKQSGHYPFGFSPKIQSIIFDKSLVTGIKGIKNGWNIDVSNNFGQNSFDFEIQNSNNASLGLKSPSTARAGGFSYLQNILNLDISKKEITKLPVPVNIALGSEIRLEQYRQKQGEEVSWQNYGELTSTGFPKEAGFQVFHGFQPVNETRKLRYNVALYTDLEANVSKKLLVGLAGRLEHYSDFGSNFSWKASTRYRFTSNLTLRTTYNTGFRAASLPQAYFSSNSSQFLPKGGEIIAFEVAHANQESSIVNRLQIPKLKPEISNNFSIGLANKITRYIRFSIDAYQINIRDRIVISGQLYPREADQLAEILSSSGVDRIQFFTNAINTKTRGLDASLKFNKRFNKKNRILFYAGFNWNKTKVINQVNTPPLLHNYKDDIFNREEMARLEKGQPGSKLILSGAYQIRQFEFSLRASRFGSVSYIHPLDANPSNWILNQNTNLVETRDQVFSSKWINDLDLSVHLFSQIKLTMAINNLFNIYPDRHKHYANTNRGIFQYSRRVQQFGVKGRMYLLKIYYNI